MRAAQKRVRGNEYTSTEIKQWNANTMVYIHNPYNIRKKTHIVHQISREKDNGDW